MLGLLGQRGGREGEGSRCCRPVVSWGQETLQVPLAAIEGDMWDRFQSRQQTPSNKPISFTLLAPTAAERGLTPAAVAEAAVAQPCGLLEDPVCLPRPLPSQWEQGQTWSVWTGSPRAQVEASLCSCVRRRAGSSVGV